LSGPLPPFWRLEDFGERLDYWAATQDASPELRRLVATWILTRFDDPYQGVRREPGFPNLWFGQVPGSLHGDHAVFCTYRIFELDRSVRCDNFATLSLPI
jgi:hypothetical protein